MRGLTESLQGALRCPVSGSELHIDAHDARCRDASCGAVFPVLDGVPVLIDESRSLFRLSDYTPEGRRDDGADGARGLLRRLAARLPLLAWNVHAEDNLRRFADLLEAEAPRPRVLIVGGGTPGCGTESVLDTRSLELCETDVAFGARTSIICDAHTLPFADGSFDGVIAQAVIEYLIHPRKAVDEMHRVLRPGGLVYAETPFMQQVHGGPFDFVRYSHVGHRELFRRFDEIASGAACGPGMALASAYRHFLMCLATTRTGRSLANAFARLTAFWIPWIDGRLVDRSAALDAAAGNYFLGRRSENELSDREIISVYRGQATF